jgi:hypothetical protein
MVVVVWFGRKVWEVGEQRPYLLAPLETTEIRALCFVAALSLSISPVDRPRHGLCHRAVVIEAVRTKAGDFVLNDIFPLPPFEVLGKCLPT